eukprot:TRINITY_DN195_c0_g1_i2.p1 TRINITY_DN195_c0_g1~~TRINITY_DN195_c0_g1_i2.p1  ORF type:complete len:265 (-),score=58.32 TRINITY_DN195_c0_g1_i2:518-1312(-)
MLAVKIDEGDSLVSNNLQNETPEKAASIAKAVSEVKQLREILQSLGEKPDHETLDLARRSLAEIESKLGNLESEVMEPSPPEMNHADWQTKQAEEVHVAQEALQKQKNPFKAVIQLYDMFEEYETLLRDAEQRLAKLTETTDDNFEQSTTKEEVDEEVVRILHESVHKSFDSVDLKGRMLRNIPEAFCKLTTLKMLDLSSNQLEMLPDSIAGLINLEELYLNANALISLPDTIGLLKNLRVLNVSANKLNALPDSISQCSAGYL